MKTTAIAYVVGNTSNVTSAVRHATSRGVAVLCITR